MVVQVENELLFSIDNLATVSDKMLVLKTSIKCFGFLSRKRVKFVYLSAYCFICINLYNPRHKQ